MKPIYFHRETLEWLDSLSWPPTAYDDFDLIRKHNDKYEQINGRVRTNPTTQPHA